MLLDISKATHIIYHLCCATVVKAAFNGHETIPSVESYICRPSRFRSRHQVSATEVSNQSEAIKSPPHFMPLNSHHSKSQNDSANASSKTEKVDFDDPVQEGNQVIMYKFANNWLTRTLHQPCQISVVTKEFDRYTGTDLIETCCKLDFTTNHEISENYQSCCLTKIDVRTEILTEQDAKTITDILKKYPLNTREKKSTRIF